MEILGIVKVIWGVCLRFRSWKIEHVWREANCCADFLVNLGCDRAANGAVVRLVSPPEGLATLLLRDSMGLGVSRVVGVG